MIFKQFAEVNFMRRFKITAAALLLAIISMSTPVPIPAAEYQIADAEELMTAYFNALKTGDVNSILDMLADPLLSSRRLLLEKNTAYPAYLRDFYQKAAFQITAVTSTKPDYYNVSALLMFSDDPHQVTSEFLLKKTDAGLKIFNELKDE